MIIKIELKFLKKNPQNLIPKVMEVGIGLREKINVYGNDYNTIDGTGVRDYVHVSDLADAHLKSISYLFENKKNITLNLGTGFGHSVLEIINETRKILGRNIRYKIVNRRSGDPGIVTAGGELARKKLNWTPKDSSLKNIIESTWLMYSNKQLTV